jgi:hypothetical protein
MATARRKLDDIELKTIEFVLRDKLIDSPELTNAISLVKGLSDPDGYVVTEYVVNVPSVEVLPRELDTSAT